MQRITWSILQSWRPVERVRDSGMGSVGERVREFSLRGASKEITSSTRIAFSGSSAADKSKAPLRCDW